jgi:predicted transcriptional regulator
MQPTSTELEFLKLLWKKSPLTSRELHQELEMILDWGYSSTRKTLDRMNEKGLISVKKEGKSNLYTPQADKMKTLASYAVDFAKRVFEFNEPLPVAFFSGSNLVDDSEISELKQLLDDLSEEQEKEI